MLAPFDTVLERVANAPIRVPAPISTAPTVRRYHLDGSLSSKVCKENKSKNCLLYYEYETRVEIIRKHYKIS